MSCSLAQPGFVIELLDPPSHLTGPSLPGPLFPQLVSNSVSCDRVKHVSFALRGDNGPGTFRYIPPCGLQWPPSSCVPCM